MSSHPYMPAVAPAIAPSAAVPATHAQALWNPHAAVGWSLLFSPAFGALVHMKNWQALGCAERAAQARLWAIGAGGYMLLVLMIEALMEESRLVDCVLRLSVLGLLAAWYAASARAQADYVKAHFGCDYPRKPWRMPLALGVAFRLVMIALEVAVAAPGGGLG